MSERSQDPGRRQRARRTAPGRCRRPRRNPSLGDPFGASPMEGRLRRSVGPRLATRRRSVIRGRLGGTRQISNLKMTTGARSTTAEQLLRTPTSHGSASRPRPRRGARIDASGTGARVRRGGDHPPPRQSRQSAGPRTGVHGRDRFRTGAKPRYRAGAGCRIRPQRPSHRGLQRVFRGAPDLAVERVSPDDRAAEVPARIDPWMAAGTRRFGPSGPANRRLWSTSRGRARSH